MRQYTESEKQEAIQSLSCAICSKAIEPDEALKFGSIFCKDCRRDLTKEIEQKKLNYCQICICHGNLNPLYDAPHDKIHCHKHAKLYREVTKTDKRLLEAADRNKKALEVYLSHI